MDVLASFWVPGKPEPRGSKQPYVIYKNRSTKEPARRADGSIIFNVTDDNPESKAWMDAVAAEARGVRGAGPLLDGALVLTLTFFLERPNGHYGTGRNAGMVKDNAPAHPTVRPDCTKLARGTEDALTDTLWVDDARVVDTLIRKRYAVPTAEGANVGCWVLVERHEEQTAASLPVEARRRPHPDDTGTIPLAL